MSSHGDYTTALKGHLASYKRERLGVFEDGVYVRKQRTYPHILPSSLYRLNILETIRREFWTSHFGVAFDRKRHLFFHHLSSSQALAINVFFPFAAGNSGGGKVEDLVAALDIGSRGPCIRAAFEEILEQPEGTQVDFLAEFAGGGRLLVEVKLTENSFGARRNDRRIAKIRDLYPLRLGNKLAAAVDEKSFLEDYQLYRYVYHLNKRDALVVLAPEANKRIWDRAHDFRQHALAGATRAAMFIVALERLVPALEARAAGGPSWFATHMQLLKEKYLMR